MVSYPETYNYPKRLCFSSLLWPKRVSDIWLWFLGRWKIATRRNGGELNNTSHGFEINRSWPREWVLHKPVIKKEQGGPVQARTNKLGLFSFCLYNDELRVQQISPCHIVWIVLSSNTLPMENFISAYGRITWSLFCKLSKVILKLFKNIKKYQCRLNTLSLCVSHEYFGQS